MSTIRITVIIDTANIAYNKDTREITNPEDCISMYDDQVNSYRKPGNENSELGTFASPGDLIIWNLFPTNIKCVDNLKFEKITNTSTDKKIHTLFNNSENRAIIYHNYTKACAAISDNIPVNLEDKEFYKYRIDIRNEGDLYWWDPFVETRVEDDPKKTL